MLHVHYVADPYVQADTDDAWTFCSLGMAMHINKVFDF